MEITRKNFKQMLNFVTESINDADFLSVDGEFTGLDAKNGGHAMPFDTPEVRYQRVRQGTCDFLLLQFGVCTFHYNEEKSLYKARPFNFYIFPRPYSRSGPDVRFLCQSSSIEFLVSQGFDFNKAFKDGISYLTPGDEANLREALHQKHQQFSQFSSPAFVTPDGVSQGTSKGPVSIPDEQKEFIKEICEKVSDFVEKSTEDKLSLPSCNGFQRKLIYQSLRAQFLSGIHLETQTDEKKERHIVVTRIKSEEDMKRREAEKQAAEVTDLDNAVGFTKVIRTISQSGKLVVGHNMMLDLIHILHQFFYPLPESYEEFKDMSMSAFPKLLDTKLMASTSPFKDRIMNTGLSDLQKILEFKPFQKPQVEIEEKFNKYTTEKGPLHEAGYDAYLTGICFICMSNFLGTFQNPSQNIVPPSSPLIQPFINKLFLMRVHDIPYLNLAGKDLTPNRDHVFHLTFPKEWKTSDLIHLFSPFGGSQIFWLDDTSAFASLYLKEEAQKVLQNLCKSGTVYTIKTYHQYQHSESGNQALSRKRPTPSTENNVPNKKRKSLNVESITPPIPEENTENMDEPNGKDANNIKAMETESSNVKDKKKEEQMFVEPEVW
ncbi:poly(A)-specific ribonuclease PARN-like isoform X2 [Ylistrum balloti]|uniref:poly(A)-specific ribonuclease PARN-like isoform X2 n=1 Tax=Ylistrum balloti TaxID=509963 RepID=UPI002905C016|nr:poly(A)-specific ribonuclease PARN-like isoform X2 [Ylistrum balloti]